MEENYENNIFFRIKEFCKGIIFSILVTIIFLVVLSAILCYTDVNENIINPSIIFISSFSILLGSFIIVKKIKEKGLLYGSILGILYMLLIYCASSFISMDFSVGVSTIVMMILGLISGAVGGIIGVNVKI